MKIIPLKPYHHTLVRDGLRELDTTWPAMFHWVASGLNRTGNDRKHKASTKIMFSRSNEKSRRLNIEVSRSHTSFQTVGQKGIWRNVWYNVLQKKGCLPRRRVASSSVSITCDRGAWNWKIRRLERKIIIALQSNDFHEIAQEHL